MFANYVRRIGVLVIALALALGPAAPVASMASMSAKMVAAGALDMAMPDGCDGCITGSQDMSATMCSAQCTVPGAILPAPPLLHTVVASRPNESAKSTAADRHRPPDPYPPRPFLIG